MTVILQGVMTLPLALALLQRFYSPRVLGSTLGKTPRVCAPSGFSLGWFLHTRSTRVMYHFALVCGYEFYITRGHQTRTLYRSVKSFTGMLSYCPSGPWATVFSGTWTQRTQSTQIITEFDVHNETHIGRYFKFVCHNYYSPNCALQYIKLLGVKSKYI